MKTKDGTKLWECLQRIKRLRFVALSAAPLEWNGVGTATVTVESVSKSVMTLVESGSWHPTTGTETSFSNVFRWSFTDKKNVRLEHLRFGLNNPVYLFDLAPCEDGKWRSISPHICDADRYSAELGIHDRGLLLEWYITGPRKNVSLTYEYISEDLTGNAKQP